MHATAAPPHPTSMVMSATIDDNNLGRFPIIQVEVKIRVPDQLVGRLIGKSGICVKKIMEETQSHISISDPRNQQEVHQYQTPELLDRIITIRGTAFSTVMAAEKQVQQKLRHIQDQDMNISGCTAVGGGGGGRQQFCPTPVPTAPPGAILQPMDASGAAIGSYIAPSAVTVTGAPMLSRGPADNAAFHHHPPAAAAVYSTPCIPMGVAPQSFFVHNHPSAATNFPLTTGQFTTHHNIAVPNLPSPPVQVKSRVYVPNQIVGILIGTKGQTIKSISAESGAVISIEGGGDRVKKESNNNEEKGKTAEMAKEEEEEGRAEKGGGGDAGGTEREAPIVAAAVDTADGGTTTTVGQNNATIVHAMVKEQQQEKTEEEGRAEKEGAATDAAVETAKEAPIAGAVDATDGGTPTTTTANSGGGSAVVGVGQNNTVGHVYQRPQNSNSPRPVFIQGYDFQVSKAQYWVFQKVADSQNKNVDEIELSCEAIVPSRVIGRIIGKGGQNVKKLQHSSGARIKVPDDIRGTSNKSNGDWASVSIHGNYYAVQTVQHHFGTLISETEWRDSREHEERRSRHWNGGNSR